MALKAVVAKLEEVSDAFRKEYTQGTDGRFYLVVEGVEGYALEDVRALKKALQETRDAVTTEKHRSDEFSKLGKQPSELESMLAEISTLRKSGTDREAAIRAQLEQYKTQSEQKSAAQETYIDKLFRDAAIAGSLAKRGASPRFLARELEQHLKVDRGQNGDRALMVIDAQGKPRLTKRPGSADNMSVEELLDEFAGDPELRQFFAQATPGTGARGSQGPGRTGVAKVSATDYDALSENIDKIAAGKVIVE